MKEPTPPSADEPVSSQTEENVKVPKMNEKTEEEIRQVARFMAMLGDTKRCKIITLLSANPDGQPFAELVSHLGALPTSASFAARILKRNNFVTCEYEGRRTHYRLNADEVNEQLTLVAKVFKVNIVESNGEESAV